MDPLGVVLSRRCVGRGVMCLLAAIVIAGCGSTATTPGPSPEPAAASGSAGSTASATAGSEPSETPSATASAYPTPRSAELTLDSLAVTIADRIVVRSQPRVAADSVIHQPPLPVGTQLHVIAGPVEASGYRWYYIEPLTFALDGDVKRGYVAVAARDGTPWVARAEGSLTPNPAWQRVANQPAFVNAAMYAVTADSRRYVAIGQAQVGPAEWSAVSWTSTDGRTWRRSTIGPAAIEQITAGAGFLAWTRNDPADFWASPDGVSWRRAPTIPSFANASISSVVWLGDRYLAAGRTEQRPFLVWSSPDGLAWRLVSDPSCSAPWRSAADVWPTGTEAGAGEPVLAAGWTSIPAGPRLVASIASVRWDAVGAYRSFAGSSSDGRCWTWKADAPRDGMILNILATGDGLVALGQHDPDIVAWTSSDGARWATARVTAGPRYDGRFVTLTEDDAGFIALGSGSRGPIGLRSADGTAWTAASVPDAARDGTTEGMGGFTMRTSVVGVAHRAAGLVAVGSICDQCDDPGKGPRAVVWIAP